MASQSSHGPLPGAGDMSPPDVDEDVSPHDVDNNGNTCATEGGGNDMTAIEGFEGMEASAIELMMGGFDNESGDKHCTPTQLNDDENAMSEERKPNVAKGSSKADDSSTSSSTNSSKSVEVHDVDADVCVVRVF